MSDNSKGELARYEASLRRQEMQWRANFELLIHCDRAAVELGIGVLRTAILINAGALVALLAFVAQVWNKDGARQLAVYALSASYPFIIGVVTGSVAAGKAYIYQSTVARKALRNFEELSSEPGSLGSIRWIETMGAISKWSMLAMVVISVLAFIYGILSVTRAFKTFA